ncbi:Gmad2 immunoglobulin-like domain-containing protein [Rubrobacter aplysinae]|uniref:Gmad2 immunoglobulin-like domain-containing protein n=1 Tax=Rubrobacter aplysinae TaxID=909625 RepID=UPI001364DDF3|nr:Gmad2 immunoglobulin-like domain-containing protein [Rubrobacter aplysinae]
MLHRGGDGGRVTRGSGKTGETPSALAPRSPLVLAATILLLGLLLALATGCGSTRGDSAQTRDQSGAGSSAGESGQQETVQGTTSEGSEQEAESTVGTVASEPAEATGDAAATPSSPSSSEAAAGEATTGSYEAPGVSATESTGEASTAPARTRDGQAASGDGPQAIANPGEFVASPEDSGGGGYMADGILGVRFGDHEGYERVVVDLGSGGEPTSGVPNWRLSSPTGDGRLKITFPSVQSTAVSDGSLEDSGAELLKSFYVVRGPEGGMFVDFFAERAFYYRVIELADPSRIAIDFKPAGSDLDIPLPVREGNTVLTQPRPGTGVTSPMTVSGYSRNPEASNTIVLQGPDGNTLTRQTVLSNDWTATWGYFETSLDFQPFAGEGLLKVGTQSARDGSFKGVELPVESAR